jgi:hypothetical protein
MMQEVVVALIVLTAAVTLLRRYLPASARKAIAGMLARRARWLGMDQLSSRLERATPALISACADGCGSCGGCGSNSRQAVQARASTSVDALRRTARK